jgi:hypothetical protein
MMFMLIVNACILKLKKMALKLAFLIFIGPDHLQYYYIYFGQIVNSIFFIFALPPSSLREYVRSKPISPYRIYCILNHRIC